MTPEPASSRISGSAFHHRLKSQKRVSFDKASTVNIGEISENIRKRNAIATEKI